MNVYLFVLIIITFLACNSVRNKNQPGPAPDTSKAVPDTGLHSMKGFELYVWEKDGTLYYNLLTGTNRIKNEKEIHDTTVATKDIGLMKKKLDQLKLAEYVSLKAEEGVDTAIVVILKDHMRRRKLHFIE